MKIALVQFETKIDQEFFRGEFNQGEETYAYKR
jgi:hypothetical protein